MRISHVLCVALGALAVSAAAFWKEPPAPPPAPPPEPDPRVGELLAQLDALDAELDALEVRAADDAVGDSLAELRERVAGLEKQVAEARDARLLDGFGESVALPEGQLIRARWLQYYGRLEESIAEWGTILDTTADPERRAEAYFEIAELQLKLKDHEAAAKAYGEVIELIGLKSVRGQTSAHRKGICETRAGDLKAAYRTYRRLVDAPTMLHSAAPTYRYWALTLALRNGDVDYARRELPSYIEDYDGIEAFKGMVENARKRLAELDEGR
jgi:tetratricopeptide (TPR) repeat protein